jgi:predicted AAA+ superfamily ATPase
MVEDPAARFENLVASHLLKFCHLVEDREGYRTELRYLRDKMGREVDFVVTVNRKPWFAVETKLAATSVEPSFHYFRERLEIPWCYQVVMEGERDFVHDQVRCLPAHRFLAALV